MGGGASFVLTSDPCGQTSYTISTNSILEHPVFHFKERHEKGLTGLGWAGLGWAGLGWAGLGWAGLGWAGLGWVPWPVAYSLQSHCMKF